MSRFRRRLRRGVKMQSQEYIGKKRLWVKYKQKMAMPLAQ